MIILDYIEPLYFFCALFIGILFAYILSPKPEIILKYPTPDNAGKIVYKDTAGVCYIYKTKEMECPSDKSKLKYIETQHVDNENKNNKGLLDLIFQ
jgi:hypothetical protein